jgi:predicted transcriptional regulator of viral defense system
LPQPTNTPRPFFASTRGSSEPRGRWRSGSHPRTLYRLRDSGRLVPVSRGVYRLADLPEPSQPGLVIVATRVPQAVVCLISALSFHGITTQVPHEVQIALPRGRRRPRLEHPPIRVFRVSNRALTAGIHTHRVDGVTVRVFHPAKTVADCFKYRNKIGLDVALEGLREAWRQRRATMDELWRYAQVCRVARVMRPYLESLA